MIRRCKSINSLVSKFVLHSDKPTILPPGQDQAVKFREKCGSPNIDSITVSQIEKPGALVFKHNMSTQPGNTSTMEGNAECHEELRKLLDHACHNAYETNRITDEEAKQRLQFLEKVLTHLRKECHPKVNLELFGSSCNGFGFPTSDIDLCLSFDGHETSKYVSPSVLIGVKSSLCTFDKCTRVKLIKHAQVPIVTFDVLGENFRHGDISLYNRLAVRNSELLRCYATLDKRCQILGHMFKHLTKASPDTLKISSYALMIMVIHFLQQCEPPVLPVLQELYTSAEQPTFTVGGWNSWFYDDLDNLEADWSGYGLNTDSVGVLWFRFLEYYSNFDFENCVITIRQLRRLDQDKKIRRLNKTAKEYNEARTRKLHWNHWVKRTIMIEDPFDQVHNLMGVLSIDSAKTLIRTIQESYHKLLRANDSLFVNTPGH